MGHYETINDVLVNLFNEIWAVEEKALITEEFKNISVNDMHIIEAVGLDGSKNMSTIAKMLDVTVGTLTIAMNNLVKKGYVRRTRSSEDRRVVLVSLDEKGVAAYHHHRNFHQEMVHAVTEDLTDEELKVMMVALNRLRNFFRDYKK